MPKAYRIMKSDGVPPLPVLGDSAAKLGVRDRDLAPNADGNAIPGVGGVSVFSSIAGICRRVPERFPPDMVPVRLHDTGKVVGATGPNSLRVFRLGEGNYEEGEIADRLRLVPDGASNPDHGTIQPNSVMPMAAFKQAIMPRSVVDYMRCRAWTELGYPEVALAFIKNAVRLDPRDSGYKHLALELLKKMKDWDALAELAHEYVTANPDDGGVLLAAGESFHDLAIQHGDPSYDERAVQYLTYGIQHTDSLETRDSQTVSGVVTLAFAMLNLGNADHAIRLLDDWVQIHSQNPELHTARGAVNLTVDYDAAIQDFKRAVRLQTKSVLPYLEYANFQIHAGKYDDAIDTTETGMLFAKRDNDLAKLNHLQAIGCAFADQPKQALHLMSKAKKLDPTDQTLSANLKVMIQLGSELGQPKSALKLPAKKTRLAYDLLRQIAA